MAMFTVSMVTSTEPTSVDQSDENATTALYRAAVGPVGGDYYLPIFSQFEEAGKAGPSWNWAAGLFTLNWLVFRQLWGAALGYAGALVLAILMVFGVGRLIFQLPQEAEFALLGIFGLASLLLPGFYGNALLQSHSRKKMAQALRTTATLSEACAVLTLGASSRRHLIGLLIVNLLFAGMIAAAFMAYRGVTTQSAAAPLMVDSARVSESPVTPAPPEPAVSVAAIPVAPVPELAVSEVPMPAVSEPAAVQAVAPDPEPAPVLTSTYLINVGLFANDANAQRVHAKLKAAKLRVYTEVLDTTNGKRTRVRVGPFKTESAANAAARKIKALKFDAVVFKQ